MNHAQHPHLAARAAFVDVCGVSYPAPAPRFSRTPSSIAQSGTTSPLTCDHLISSWAVNACL
jgi:alpha-methylacyl-CoA racemase